VLIDDAENAVLCDFGLSFIRADVTSRAVKAISKGQGPVGSRNWMAPERLRGESPKKPSDIYAFGMTIYEVS
jgi:serine/threonine protein kinase